METPLSSRRITRSQALTMSARVENEESTNKGFLKSRHQERENSPLIDIANGSPIVGLAMGSLKTPCSSRCSRKRVMIPNSSESKKSTTPGSGETLLRGQVKTLLQKVEEEGDISKICFEPNPLIYNNKRFINSPMAVLAPTPANTPQVYNFNNSLESFIVSPVAENFSFTQLLNEVIAESNKKNKGEENVITRSLFMDFSEKSHDSDSGSSLWSVQANASASEESKNNEDFEDVVVDELCEEISKISVNKDAKFTGKHTRFEYDSDGGSGEELSSSSSKGSM